MKERKIGRWFFSKGWVCATREMFLTKTSDATPKPRPGFSLSGRLQWLAVKPGKSVALKYRVEAANQEGHLTRNAEEQEIFEHFRCNVGATAGCGFWPRGGSGCAMGRSRPSRSDWRRGLQHAKVGHGRAANAGCSDGVGNWPKCVNRGGGNQGSAGALVALNR